MIERDVLRRGRLAADTHPQAAAVQTAQRLPARRRPAPSRARLDLAVTGCFSAAALVTADALGLRPWVLFLAWVGYGLLGGSLQGGLRLLACVALGAAAGMATVVVADAARPWAGVSALPVALGLSCGLLATWEARPPRDRASACFIGMIAFFAAGEPPSTTLFGALVAPAALGVAWAWAAAAVRAPLERRLERG